MGHIIEPFLIILDLPAQLADIKPDLIQIPAIGGPYEVPGSEILQLQFKMFFLKFAHIIVYYYTMICHYLHNSNTFSAILHIRFFPSYFGFHPGAHANQKLPSKVNKWLFNKALQLIN